MPSYKLLFSAKHVLELIMVNKTFYQHIQNAKSNSWVIKMTIKKIMRKILMEDETLQKTTNQILISMNREILTMVEDLVNME